MSSITISPPNAILFVFDPTNKNVVVPDYVDGRLTAATETCVSVGTQAPVDGDTEVHLVGLHEADPTGMEKMFEGTIATPGGCVAVVTAELERVLELEVRRDEVAVVIWADDRLSPARLLICV